jgi:bacterioferritin-associated ferredoxin
MIVCLCHGISDRVVRAAIRAGADSEAQVAEVCGAGSCCGGCKPTIQELIHEESERGVRRRLPLVAASSVGLGELRSE